MDGKRVLNSLEIDFVVNRGSRRYYIQSAYRADDLEKENGRHARSAGRRRIQKDIGCKG